MNTQLEQTQSLTAADLFQSARTPEDFVSRIREEVTTEVFDITTEAGRKRCKSQAAKVAKTKTAVDKVGKALSDELSADAKKVVAKRKIFRDELDKVRDDVRAPVTAWEAEQATIAANIKANQDDLHDVIKTTDAFGSPLSIKKLEYNLGALRDLKITKETFGENAETTYMPIRFAGINAIEFAIKAIKDAEELAILNREKEEREAKQVADAEKARIEKEAVARHESQKSPHPVIEAHVPPVEDVMNPTGQATMHEALGIAPPKATDPKRDAMNEAYVSIRAVVGLSDTDTKSIVQAIADGMITNITLNH